jgi:hypothetical protein
MALQATYDRKPTLQHGETTNRLAVRIVVVRNVQEARLLYPAERRRCRARPRASI